MTLAVTWRDRECRDRRGQLHAPPVGNAVVFRSRRRAIRFARRDECLSVCRVHRCFATDHWCFERTNCVRELCRQRSEYKVLPRRTRRTREKRGGGIQRSANGVKWGAWQIVGTSGCARRRDEESSGESSPTRYALPSIVDGPEAPRTLLRLLRRCFERTAPRRPRHLRARISTPGRRRSLIKVRSDRSIIWHFHADLFIRVPSARGAISLARDAT